MAVANGRVEKEIGAKGFWGEGAKSWIIPRLILSLSLSLRDRSGIYTVGISRCCTFGRIKARGIYGLIISG